MRIAVIDDNPALAKGVAWALRDQGHAVDLIADGAQADSFLRAEGADLVVLDINLPGMDGLSLLRAMRRRGDGTPVILLTARGELDDRVSGLDAGADDYLAKPFEMAELLARVRALSRRKAIDYGANEQIGPMAFDRGHRQVSVSGEPLDLPRKELAVLECLIDNRGRLVPRATLIDHVYGVGADVADNAIEPHISRLRRRLGPHGIGIKAARGLGYLLEVPE